MKDPVISLSLDEFGIHIHFLHVMYTLFICDCLDCIKLVMDAQLCLSFTVLENNRILLSAAHLLTVNVVNVNS